MTKESVSVLIVSMMVEPKGNGFVKAMSEVFTNHWCLSPGPTLNEDIIRMINLHKPDCTFIQIQADNILRPSVLSEIVKSTFVIGFSGDKRHATEQFYIDWGRHQQLTCFSNQDDVDTCRKLGVASEFLQLGYDPEIYKPIKREKSVLGEKHDSVVAMFNNYGAVKFPLSKYREDIVNALAAKYPTQFSVYGGGWGNARGNFNHSQPEEAYKYNQARMAISVSHFSADRYASDRLLRSIGSGTLTLSHRFPNMELDWKEDEHLVCFDTIPELYDKIDYYLERPIERERIAYRGQQYCVTNFTFLHMANNILNLYLNKK